MLIAEANPDFLLDVDTSGSAARFLVMVMDRIAGIITPPRIEPRIPASDG